MIEQFGSAHRCQSHSPVRYANELDADLIFLEGPRRRLNRHQIDEHLPDFPRLGFGDDPLQQPQQTAVEGRPA
jgi:hypothetical protein